MSVSRQLTKFWSLDTRRCVLWYEDEVFELRLYDKGKLVALVPCDTPERAFELSVVWRHHPPVWPPE